MQSLFTRLLAWKRSSDRNYACGSWLLQLPSSALTQVLQQLDQRSLACTAVTCSTLKDAVLAATIKVAVRCSTPETLGSFTSWLDGHSSSLNNLTQISVVKHGKQDFLQLCITPCPQLRHLRLEGLEVQLGPANSLPGVLGACPGLTGLDLQNCRVRDGHAAVQAIAALPELRSLTLDRVSQLQSLSGIGVNTAPYYCDLHDADMYIIPQQLPELTYLKLRGLHSLYPGVMQLLSQLVGLTNLCQLDLSLTCHDSTTGSLLSELVQLTCLDIVCEYGCDTTRQFQHVSRFTALRQLAVTGSINMTAEDLSGVQQLSQLTGLEVIYATGYGHPPRLEFSSSSNSSWLTLTALQSLALRRCKVQPEALSELTQLKTLSLVDVQYSEGASLEQLLGAVSQLTLLTDLKFVTDVARAPAATFTALAASTNLCSLKLYVGCMLVKGDEVDWSLFQPGRVYPYLRVVDLQCQPLHRGYDIAVPPSEQQLQLLCSCCPAACSLRFAFCENPSLTVLQPLKQLSVLTALELYRAKEAGVAVVATLAQLTRLKRLELQGLCLFHLQRHTRQWRRSLHAQTALTGLQQLTLKTRKDNITVSFQNKACWFRPPDVWMQLRDRMPI